jgi:hypothetical protein
VADVLQRTLDSRSPMSDSLSPAARRADGSLIGHRAVRISEPTSFPGDHLAIPPQQRVPRGDRGGSRKHVTPTWPFSRTHAAQTGLFPRAQDAKCVAKMGTVAQGEPRWPTKLLKTKDRDWRRGWDSDPTASFGFCKLQIPQCQHCHECQAYCGVLHAVARTVRVV